MDIYKKQNMGNRIGFGEKPALLIIDLQNAFTDENFFGGHNINVAIDNTTHLLHVCRQAQIPIAHVRFVTSNDGSDIGTFGLKVPRLKDLVDGTSAADIVDSLKPKSDEFVSIKHHASAFFWYHLAVLVDVQVSRYAFDHGLCHERLCSCKHD
jgi:maleamate amidohydrolase